MVTVMKIAIMWIQVAARFSDFRPQRVHAAPVNDEEPRSSLASSLPVVLGAR